MKNLDLNWITKGLLDFEYKKYILLAYLKEVNKSFDESKLYPFLSDLIMHRQNLLSIKKNKKITKEQFPKKLSKIDFENFTVEYERLVEDDKYFKELEDIIGYAIPLFERHIVDGRDIYESVEEKLDIFPVGVVPLNQEAGYMFLREANKKNMRVYEYQITIFENANERFRGIKMEYVTSYFRNITNTYEMIKTDLISNHKKIANPATYAVESKLVLPLKETLLPIAKRSLVRYIGNDAA